MKVQQFAFLMLLTLVTGGSGYFWGGLSGSSPSVMPAQVTPPLEYFLSAQSFSEVENAKAMLDALSRRLVAELMSEPLRSMMEAKEQRDTVTALPDSSRVIKELEQAIGEFKGTEQELSLTQDLMFLLKREKRYDRWLDIYLRTLYRHPTHELVGRFAGAAMTLGKSLGRQEEVLNGFKHLSGIPFEFEAKSKIESALMDYGLTMQVRKGAINSPS